MSPEPLHARPEDFADRVIDRCASTNDLCRLLGEAGYPHGSWVSARNQERGRGRLGREWQSLEGNLFFSFLARPARKELVSWIPLAAGVACAVAARRVGAPAGLRLKWPNDLWLGGAKAGGILCEGVNGPQGLFVVIGVGINCARAPQGLATSAVSLGVEVEALRPVLIEEMRGWLGVLEREGAPAIRGEYERRALLSAGTPVHWGGCSGVALGLGDSGELRVRRDSDGAEVRLLAEDVSIRPVGAAQPG